MAPPKRGYHKLALFMDSVNEAAIFRRFGKLNILNLLALQAELMVLEDEYNRVWDKDEQGGDVVRGQFATDFKVLRTSSLESIRQGSQLDEWKMLVDIPEEAENVERTRFAVNIEALKTSKLAARPRNPPRGQWEILLDIRAKLKEYNEALLQVTQVQTLNGPEKAYHQKLRDWLFMADKGAGQITGLESLVWDEAHDADLICLNPDTRDKAPFSSWATGRFLTFFNDKWGFKYKIHATQVNPEAGADIVNYDETAIFKYTRYLITILASLLPIVCIVVLWAVHSIGWRLGIMAIFTAVFAGILVVFTSAKEVEIFASTAAFAAVEVVFIGTPSPSFPPPASLSTRESGIRGRVACVLGLWFLAFISCTYMRSPSPASISTYYQSTYKLPPKTPSTTVWVETDKVGEGVIMAIGFPGIVGVFPVMRMITSSRHISEEFVWRDALIAMGCGVLGV